MAVDKKAYAKEYYQKYTKKGLKKGRKKAKQENLVGVSTSGLNQEGRIEAQFIKDDLKKQMNAALAKAKTDEEKLKIKKEFSLKAAQEMNRLKSDPKFAKPTTAKKSRSSKSSESSKSSGSSSKKSSGSKSSGSAKSSNNSTKQISTAEVEKLSKTIDDLKQKINDMTQEQEDQVKTLLVDIISEIKKQMGISGEYEGTELAWLMKQE